MEIGDGFDAVVDVIVDRRPRRSRLESAMKFIKADGIPLVVTLFALLMGVGGTIIGIGALIDPTSALDFVDGADKMGTAWGGRNMGLGIASIVAVLLRKPAGYAAAFAGGICREFSDLVAGLSDGGSLNIPFTVVLLLELVALAIAVRATLMPQDNAAQRTSP